MNDFLLLDPQIRDWVVLPMVMMLVLVGMGRHYVSELIKTDPIITSDTLDEMRHKQTLMRSARVRANGGFIPEESFNRRKSFFIRRKKEDIPGGGAMELLY